MGSRRLLVVLGVVLAAMVAVPTAASAASLVADYRFDDNLNSSVPGAPPLEPLTRLGNEDSTYADAIVNGREDRVLVFPKGNGVAYDPGPGAVPANNYSVMFTYEHNAQSGYQRLIQFEDALADSDNGLYSYDDYLGFYEEPWGPKGVLFPDVYRDVTITRAPSGIFRAFLADTQQFQFLDPGDLSLIGSDGLRFFQDDNNMEEEAGSVARIRIYSGVLTPVEIATIRETGGLAATAAQTGKVKLVPRKRKKAKRVATGLALTCPAEGAPCKASASVKRLIPVQAAGKKKKKPKAPKVFGHAEFTIPPGGTAKNVKVKLSKRARKYVKRKGKRKVEVEARAIVTPSSGVPSEASQFGKF